MDWHDLLTAFALYLVLEGIVPFISPSGFKEFVATMGKLKDSTLRRVGAVSMAAGVALLYLAR